MPVCQKIKLISQDVRLRIVFSKNIPSNMILGEAMEAVRRYIPFLIIKNVFIVFLKDISRNTLEKYNF